ncbi:phosphatase PAP2 family protein [Aquibacillus salsiterrae]|uniref:Phosphatase PAP2 family protein n=1 Tax=Aquibacillus salsiterrae TaxID=2950439 RepID=A0A9X4AES7_9BACI|nr:phosphatase PAP2 family protein [Aquibacillus salsiterrae]MDC3417262.1 phosphatase PAP2 family protein [Aquibacillus salsiterrae]
MNRSIRFNFYLSFLMLALVTGLVVLLRVRYTDMPIIDKWAMPFAVGLEDTVIFEVFRWITELGSSTFLTPLSILFAIGLWFYTKDWLASIVALVGPYLGHKLNYWIKINVERERPRIFAEAEGIGYSFPSGHAMISVIVYGLVIYFTIKYVKSTKLAFRINLIGIILIILIGMSRYVIRVHYLTDVLAGFAFGVVCLLLCIKIYEYLFTWKGKIVIWKSVSRRR